MNKKFFLGFLILIIVFSLISCAAGPNMLEDQTSSGGSSAGFFLGLWHGMIVVITFIISLFSDSVSVYEVYNNGGWYNFGFLIGIGAFTGGCSSSRN